MTLGGLMEKPKNKWWDVKKFDIGRTLGNPDYIQWADERIRELENQLASKQYIEADYCKTCSCYCGDNINAAGYCSVCGGKKIA